MTFDRRRFLQAAAATGVSGLTLNTLGSFLPGFQAHAADTTGYKALVCVFLFGGMDCHDTVLPYDQTSYDDYVDARSDLVASYGSNSSRSRDRLLQLNPDNASDFNGRQFALPEELAGIHSLFEAGNAAIVGNVGPLVTPANRTQWIDRSVPFPKRLFSHNDQQSTWQTFSPEGANIGWAGRFLDASNASSANATPAFSAITTSGNSVFLNGENTSPYPITRQGGAEFSILEAVEGERHTPEGEVLYQAVRSHLQSANLNSSHLYMQDYADAASQALENSEVYNEAFQNAPSLFTSFPTHNLGRQLQSVAQSISLRNTLGMKRQVFFVTLGGFDTHDRQAQRLPPRQAQIDSAVTAFFNEMQALGVGSDVTLFTASDFGRTLAANGDGTDHGWGGHHFVVGEGVSGRNIYGSIPPSTFDHEYDAKHGRLIPTVSLEQFAEPLGRWFGLNNQEIAQALPNLSGFTENSPSLFV